MAQYGTTSFLLYTLAELGFSIDIMQYGMNVVMDTVNFAIELQSSNGNYSETFTDMSEQEFDGEGDI